MEEYLSKNDLIEGEYYVYDYIHYYAIGKCLKSSSTHAACIGGEDTNYNGGNSLWRDNSFTGAKKFRLATLEQKHWLNVCIEADKYIPYEEAMKTYTE
jgi:hypothetical protein